MSKEGGAVPGTGQAHRVETIQQCPSQNTQIHARLGFGRLKGVERTLISIVRDRPFEEARGNPLPATPYHPHPPRESLEVFVEETEARS